MLDRLPKKAMADWRALSQPIFQKLPEPVRRGLPYLVLASLCLLPYLHTLSGPLIWDDHLLITESRAIRDLGGIYHLFSLSYWTHENPGTPGQYRPLRAALFALGYALWGDSSIGYRAVNMAFFMLATFLVYVVGRGLFRDSRAGFLAGAFFALHPAHTETVAWVKNYTELLACCLTLGGLWSYLRGWDAGGPCWRILSVILAPLAFLAKETALVYPFLLAAWEWSRGGLRGLAKNLIRLSPHLVVLAFYMGFLLLVLGNRVTRIEPPPLHMLQRVCVVLRSVWFYFKDLFFPVGLNAEPVLDKSASFLDPAVWAGALVSFGMAWLAWRLRKVDKGTAFSFVWIMLCMLPIVNIRYITGRPLADQRVFLASVGACWLAGRLASLALARPLALMRPPDWIAAVCASIGVVLAGGAAATHVRNWVWTDPVFLFEDTVSKSPRAERAYYNLGNTYKDRGEWEKAIQSYRRAIDLDPGYEGTRNNLGLVYYYKGEYEKAEEQFLIALKIKPLLAATLMNLGVLYLEMGRLELSVEYLQKATVASPNNPEPRYHLAMAFLKLGRMHEAEQELRTTVALDPRHTEARVQLAHLQLQLKESRQEALAQLEQALKENPKDYAALVMSGDLLAAKGEGQEAMRRYERAIQVEPRHPWAHAQKGLLLESNGDLVGAEAAYREALSLDPASGLGNLRLGALLMTKQRLEDAAKHLQRALAAEPREPEVHLYMARLLLEYQDRLPQAISYLRNVLTLAPDHPQRGQILGLIENLQEVLRSQGPPEPER